ncbi:MAG: hypothetical protein K5656_03910 [Lachnospiraceae bacterium]|nr:hypothetical protein [Lachnospiraceae bacterium]
MKFNSIDEIDKFSFKDAEIREYKSDQDAIEFTIEALIVKQNNSQNTNYTDSYADTAYLRLDKGEILSAFKEGYSYYDANDKLIEKKEDEKLSLEETNSLLKSSKGAYLYEIKYEDDKYSLAIEFIDGDQFDPADSTSYYVFIKADSLTVSWDRYLNRVQN